MLYSGLNFQDLMVRLGAIDSPPKTPCILGFECSGEVEAVGEEVEDFKVIYYSFLSIANDFNLTEMYFL
jgi:NADPH:quinone reductase-like Zn-dependent oxidoreductase